MEDVADLTVGSGYHLCRLHVASLAKIRVFRANSHSRVQTVHTQSNICASNEVKKQSKRLALELGFNTVRYVIHSLKNMNDHVATLTCDRLFFSAASCRLSCSLSKINCLT
jgi:hypothetical protein